MQFHVPRFRKDRVEALERVAAGARQPERADLPDGGLLQPARRRRRRTSSWAASWPSSATATSSATRASAGTVWVVPILGGEFVIDRRFGYRDGLMGGNLWFMGRDLDAALLAAERAAEAASRRCRA